MHGTGLCGYIVPLLDKHNKMNNLNDMNDYDT